ncbi:MAG: transposase [Candidatus Sulfotelmatobacter sp.]
MKMPLPIYVTAVLAQFQIGKLHKISCFWVAQRLRRCDTAARVRAALAAEVHSMAAPRRGNTGYSCYFITASTFQKRNILQPNRMAGLFVDVLLHYRRQGKYLLHEFVVMPDHIHLLITPVDALERAMQLIKGGFSYRAKKELGFAHDIWQSSYYDRRVCETWTNISLSENIFGTTQSREVLVSHRNSMPIARQLRDSSWIRHLSG